MIDVTSMIPCWEGAKSIPTTIIRRARSMRLAIFDHMLPIQLRAQGVQILYIHLQRVLNMLGDTALVAHSGFHKRVGG